MEATWMTCLYEERGFITRQMLRDEPNKLFVFGDNFMGKGLRGLAAECRGEPNAVGIPTKRKPGGDDQSYLYDEDLDEWRAKASVRLDRLIKYAGVIVWPLNNIGTTYAMLNITSPAIKREIDYFREKLKSRTITLDMIKKFLNEMGWHTWYNENCWVNKRVVSNPDSDYTQYGMSLVDAYSFELSGKEHL